MGLGGDRFGVGINWLQRPATVDDDEGRGTVLRPIDLPPMFRPGRDLHHGEATIGEDGRDGDSDT